MKIGASALQTVVLAALAVTTTLVTTSVTYYLLSRPWCIQLDQGGDQTILYGENQCIQRENYRMASDPNVNQAF